MFDVFKKVAARCPTVMQQEMKRWYFWGILRAGYFKTDEPEYAILEKYVSNEDWVIDIGANVGHYTEKLSKLVGPKGRVIAVEPVPESFYLLTSNSSHFLHKNTTLINAAISDCSTCVGIEMPKFKTGLNNYYQAHISPSKNSMLNVLCFKIDSLCLPHPIRLIKIDAEGHEYLVLRGAKELIIRDKPTIIIEGDDKDVKIMLCEIGYSEKNLMGSPNRIFTFAKEAGARLS